MFLYFFIILNQTESVSFIIKTKAANAIMLILIKSEAEKHYLCVYR